MTLVALLLLALVFVECVDARNISPYSAFEVVRDWKRDFRVEPLNDDDDDKDVEKCADFVRCESDDRGDGMWDEMCVVTRAVAVPPSALSKQKRKKKRRKKKRKRKNDRL